MNNPNQSMTETSQPSATDYRFESNRLKSFDSSWPHSHFLDPSKMSSAGFFYYGVGDLCRCAFCNVLIGNWKVGDDPMKEHQDCPYAHHRPTGNIPLTVTSPSLGFPSNSQENRGYDECGIYNNHHDVIPVRILPNSKSENAESSNLDDFGVHKMRAPSFPHMGPYDSRLNTFKCWPKSKQEKLCEAGFYYTGKDDKTLCYHCGGGLENWEDTDDPWTEHAKWFSKCAFLLLVKGKAFVDKVQAEFKKESVSNTKETASTTITPGHSEPTTSIDKVDEQASSKPSTSSDDARLCKICFAEEVGVVFLPCGHFVACVKCAPALSTCIICRQPFSGVVRAFIS